jgi:hypothetical protein
MKQAAWTPMSLAIDPTQALAVLIYQQAVQRSVQHHRLKVM